MASKRRLRRNACDGKKRFPDKATARHYGHIWARKLRHGFVPYDCRYCGGVHLASSKPHRW